MVAVTTASENCVVPSSLGLMTPPPLNSFGANITVPATVLNSPVYEIGACTMGNQPTSIIADAVAVRVNMPTALSTFNTTERNKPTVSASNTGAMGSNQLTTVMNGERPTVVTAIASAIDNYPAATLPVPQPDAMPTVDIPIVTTQHHDALHTADMPIETTQQPDTMLTADMPIVTTQQPAAISAPDQPLITLPSPVGTKSKQWSSDEVDALLCSKQKYVGQNNVYQKIKNNVSFANVLKDRSNS